MTQSLRLALAQANLKVGAIQANAEQIIAMSQAARDTLKADVVVFPELALTSYPPEDLLLRPALSEQVNAALQRIGDEAQGIDVILGYPRRVGRELFNAVGLLRDGKLVAEYHKQHLPNYSVFDEKRYFTPGTRPTVVDLKGIPTALNICEDIWVPGTAAQGRLAGARLIININASPFHEGKAEQREQVLKAAVAESGLPIVYLNLVGGQDELVFDGGSVVLDASGTLCLRTAEFSHGLHLVEIEDDGKDVRPIPGIVVPHAEPEASIYQALVTGVRDYAGKNGFKGAVLGLSGGIDSALTLAIAVDALGSDAVEVLLMPSKYTASMSIEDAVAQCQTLGVKHHIISIEGPVEAFDTALKELFAGLTPDITEENIQARCRGVLLMALSNKSGKLLLTTGNKSEMAVGYATLYGDMAGGFAPLKDVPKMLVYRLAHWRNRLEVNIPDRVIKRAPSAELRPDQKDEDSLPAYPLLDAILELYIERDASPQEIIAAGFDANIVQRVIGLVDRNEYKRRQAAPGVKISARAFGRDRRYPITSGYRE